MAYKTNPDYLNPITRAYLNKFIAAGVRIPPRLDEVDNFVKQLSSIISPELWICWPMRSIHNAGTGTQLFSLGKTNLEGLFVNGPTWGNDGITFATNASTGRDRHIAIPFTKFDPRTNGTFIAISDFGENNGGAAFDQFIIGSNAANGSYGGINTRDGEVSGDMTVNGPTNVGNTSYVIVAGQTLSAGTYRMWTTQKENNLATNSNVQGNKLWRDTTLLGNGSHSAQVGFETMNNPVTTLCIGNGRTNTSLAPIGIISLVLFIQNWTVSMSQVRNILQQTVCRGLL